MKIENYYKIGDLINPLPIQFENVQALFKECFVRVPSRIDTFLCHHNYFANPPRRQVYPVGAINFVIDQFTQAKVEVINGDEIILDDEIDRKSIILHTALVLKKTLGFKEGLKIQAKNLHLIKHGGFGSSAALQTSVAIAINNIFGNKIPNTYLIKLLSQNYGEESDRPGFLSPMASIGGASASAMLNSNTIIIGGESEIWKQYNLPKEYKVVIAIPDIKKLPDGILDMELYQKGFLLFEKLGLEWGHIKEDILKNKIIYGLNNKDMSSLFESINMYTIGAFGDIPQYFRHRWLSHSIFMDEFIHEIYYSIYKEISNKENCFFVSSGGPSIAFITKEATKVKQILNNYPSLKIFECELYNKGPIIKLN